MTLLTLLTLLVRVDEQTPRDLGHGLLSGSDSTVVFLTQNNTKARKSTTKTIMIADLSYKERRRN